MGRSAQFYRKVGVVFILGKSAIDLQDRQSISQAYIGRLLDDGLEDDGGGGVGTLVPGDLEGVNLDTPLSVKMNGSTSPYSLEIRSARHVLRALGSTGMHKQFVQGLH